MRQKLHPFSGKKEYNKTIAFENAFESSIIFKVFFVCQHYIPAESLSYAPTVFNFITCYRLVDSLLEDVGLMIWNRAHAELSYLQEIDKWKDKVMAEDTGIKAVSKYHV